MKLDLLFFSELIFHESKLFYHAFSRLNNTKERRILIMNIKALFKRLKIKLEIILDISNKNNQ